jgi:hypothetical protein
MVPFAAAGGLLLVGTLLLAIKYVLSLIKKRRRRTSGPHSQVGGSSASESAIRTSRCSRAGRKPHHEVPFVRTKMRLTR